MNSLSLINIRRFIMMMAIILAFQPLASFAAPSGGVYAYLEAVGRKKDDTGRSYNCYSGVVYIKGDVGSSEYNRGRDALQKIFSARIAEHYDDTVTVLESRVYVLKHDSEKADLEMDRAEKIKDLRDRYNVVKITLYR